jgi:hypothetical protein
MRLIEEAFQVKEFVLPKDKIMLEYLKENRL